MAFFSTNSKDYASAIQALTKPEYTSKYDDTISGIMDKITNKEPFSYDFNADPLYQNYKDQYTKLGKEAGINAAAAVAANTSGYGNSYAATAASQANQQYLTQLNDVIPELAQAALNKYQMEKEDLYNQFNMYSSEENRLYGQYRDSVNDYYSDYNNLSSGYGTALQNEQWQAQMDYQRERDQIADQRWQTEFDNDNYWKQLNYDLSKSKGSGGSGAKKTTTTSKTTDANKANNASVIAADAIKSYGAATQSNLTNGVNTSSGRPFITNLLNDTNNLNNALAILNMQNLTEEEYKIAYNNLVKQFGSK